MGSSWTKMVDGFSLTPPKGPNPVTTNDVSFGLVVLSPSFSNDVILLVQDYSIVARARKGI